LIDFNELGPYSATTKLGEAPHFGGYLAQFHSLLANIARQEG